MDSLIIRVDFRKATENFCPIETFLGELKVLKKKTFSGPLRSVDISKVDVVANIPSSQLNRLKDFFYNDTRQIKKDKYFLNYIDIEHFVRLLKKIKGIFYSVDDRSLHELDDYHYATLKVDGNSKVYLELEPGRKDINRNCYCYNINGKAIFIIDNNIYFIRNKINVPLIQQFIKNEHIFLNNVAEINNILSPIDNLTNKQVFVNINPSPIMYINFYGNYLEGKLYFSYNGLEVPSNSQEEYFNSVFGNELSTRNLQEEYKIVEYLLKNGWRKSKGNKFILCDEELLNRSLNLLLDKDFEIFTLDHRPIHTSRNAQFNISYGVDWFELNVKANNKDVTHLIDLKSRKRFIEVDEDLLLLPDALWDKKNIFQMQNGKIVSRKRNIGQIFEIIDQPNISASFDPNKVVSLEKISLSLPPDLDERLRPYQRDGVLWLTYLYKNLLGGCLADDMGLGKTIQAIAFIISTNNNLKGSSTTLIVVPKTLIENWINETNKFGMGISISVYHGPNRGSALNKFKQIGGILITTYNTLLNDAAIFDSISFDCMFLDEAQYIKNRKAKTYHAAKGIKSKAKFALSGTPFENNISELWAIMDLLNPGCLDSYTMFMKQYGNNTNDKDELKRLNSRIRPFILRRTKTNVLKDLPEKTELELICSMSEDQRILYKSILESVKNEINRLPERFEIKDASIILDGLLRLRQVCCHPSLLKKEYNWNHCNESGKFDLLQEKIIELTENHYKVIIFSQFTSMLNIIRKWTLKKGINTFYLDGQTLHRQSLVNSFEESEDGVFLISLKAGGVGLNIVSCQYAIIYDPWWNPAVESQAADRIHRIGQAKDVFIYRYITADSIEEKINKLKATKKDLVNNLLLNTGELKNLTINDLKNLL